MNEQELFLVVVAALVVGNIANKIIVNPLIYKLQNVLFGNPHESSKSFSGTDKSSKL